MWNLQYYPTTVLDERMWHFRRGGGQNRLTLWPIFSWSQDPHIQDLQGRSQDFHWGQLDKTEGPKAESGVEFLGRGQQPSPTSLGVCGSAVGSSSGVRADPRPSKCCPLFSALRMASPDTIVLLMKYHAAIGGKTPVAPCVSPCDSTPLFLMETVHLSEGSFVRSVIVRNV